VGTPTFRLVVGSNGQDANINARALVDSIMMSPISGYRSYRDNHIQVEEEQSLRLAKHNLMMQTWLNLPLYRNMSHEIDPMNGIYGTLRYSRGAISEKAEALSTIAEYFLLKNCLTIINEYFRFFQK